MSHYCALSSYRPLPIRADIVYVPASHRITSHLRQKKKKKTDKQETNNPLSPHTYFLHHQEKSKKTKPGRQAPAQENSRHLHGARLDRQQISTTRHIAVRAPRQVRPRPRRHRHHSLHRNNSRDGDVLAARRDRQGDRQRDGALAELPARVALIALGVSNCFFMYVCIS